MSEIEKLRSLLAEARKALSYGCWSGSCCRVRAKIDAALAEPVADDFRRGAEAMRKAAVTYFQCGPYDGCNNGEHYGECDNCETADIIDALPIPEDK